MYVPCASTDTHSPTIERSENGADASTTEADLFDVGVDKELSGTKRGRGDYGGGPNAKRQKRDQKFGYGGKKRNAKSGDASSSGDLSGFSARKMKGKFGAGGGKPAKTARLGKARRQAVAAKR